MITEWKNGAPRWVLLGLLGISMSINAFLGAATVGLVIERFQLVEKANNDPWHEKVIQLSETQAVQAARLRQHDDLLNDIRLNLRLIDDIDKRLRRKGI